MFVSFLIDADEMFACSIDDESIRIQGAHDLAGVESEFRNARE
jgi:hypothetical protein